MSDALTDIGRDQRRSERISVYLEKLYSYLEKPSKKKYSKLESAAISADDVPRGYWGLISKLREGDELEWARLLSGFDSLEKSGELYKKFEDLSPFKGKTVIRVHYGDGFLVNTDEIADLLVSNLLREMGHSIYSYQEYFMIMPPTNAKKIKVIKVR